MEIPKPGNNKFSVVFAESSTGNILNSDLTLFLNSEHTSPFQIFNNIETAEFYALNNISNNPTIEGIIYDYDGNFVKILDIKTDKINLINYQLEKLKKTKWKAFIEGSNFTSGSSFIMVNTELSREKDIEILGANDDEINFIANSKENIRFLLAEVKKLQKKLNQIDNQ